MDYHTTFGDERALGLCALCGDSTETRDHVPPKVLLDDPLSSPAAVVPACERCNRTLSRDEEYFACAVEVALKGTTELVALRPKVQGILHHSPKLALRLARSLIRVPDPRSGRSGWPELSIEIDRVSRVVVKVARGHALHELHDPQYNAPASVSFWPMHVVSRAKRQDFEMPPIQSLWPEVGSRALQRLVLEGGPHWVCVQRDRYRFLAWTDGAPRVRMVFSEYLAAEVTWPCG